MYKILPIKLKMPCIKQFSSLPLVGLTLMVGALSFYVSAAENQNSLGQGFPSGNGNLSSETGTLGLAIKRLSQVAVAVFGILVLNKFFDSKDLRTSSVQISAKGSHGSETSVDHETVVSEKSISPRVECPSDTQKKEKISPKDWQRETVFIPASDVQLNRHQVVAVWDTDGIYWDREEASSDDSLSPVRLYSPDFNVAPSEKNWGLICPVTDPDSYPIDNRMAFSAQLPVEESKKVTTGSEHLKIHRNIPWMRSSNELPLLLKLNNKWTFAFK